MFPSTNGGLQYFHAEVPGGGANFLLTLFTDHVDDTVTNPPPRCVDGRPLGGTGQLMDQ
jgi:hypothetical protein